MVLTGSCCTNKIIDNPCNVCENHKAGSDTCGARFAFTRYLKTENPLGQWDMGQRIAKAIRQQAR